MLNHLPYVLGIKNLLNLRTLARPLIKHKVGNGTNTFLWHDNWHSKGPLSSTYGARIIYDPGLPSIAKVNSIISENSWIWPFGNTIELMEIGNLLGNVPSPNGTQDIITWSSSPNGQFHTKSTCKAIYKSHPKVNWAHLIWFSGVVPRQSFIL